VTKKIQNKVNYSE